MKSMIRMTAAALLVATAVAVFSPMTVKAESPSQAKARIATEEAAARAHDMNDIAHEVKVAIKDGKEAVIDVTRIKSYYAWVSKRVWDAATDEAGLTKADLKVVYTVKRVKKTYVIPAGTDSALFWDNNTNHFGGFDYIASQIGVTPVEVK